MALENIVRGATHFKLAKTDVGGPISAFFGKNRPINSLKTAKRQVQYMVAVNAMPPADHRIRLRNLLHGFRQRSNRCYTLQISQNGHRRAEIGDFSFFFENDVVMTESGRKGLRLRTCCVRTYRSLQVCVTRD